MNRCDSEWGMALTTRIKNTVNRLLRPCNLRVETLTKEKRELHRIGALGRAGHFREPVFPLPAGFARMEPEPVLHELSKHAARFESFEHPARNDVGYSFANSYFSSPDAEVLYALVTMLRPAAVLEIGAGSSTQIIRQAILDGGLQTSLISVDPHPRLQIKRHVDRLVRHRVESCAVEDLSRLLKNGDILFIDSSHEIKPGNDVVFLFLRLLPCLPAGVVVHVHDVFLPYEYPLEWVRNQWDWSEQYLVGAMLLYGDAFDVIWAGQYLQRTRPDFPSWFPHCDGRRGQSLWLRKREG